ncbi:MAG: hypothetical protein AAFV72_26455, partial [Cyanobacteria bacterium J06635_1]
MKKLKGRRTTPDSTVPDAGLNTETKDSYMIATAPTSGLPNLDDSRSGLPNICGWEDTITAVTNHAQPVFLPATNLRIPNITAGFA